jgi:hypothetical protein
VRHTPLTATEAPIVTSASRSGHAIVNARPSAASRTPITSAVACTKPVNTMSF